MGIKSFIIAVICMVSIGLGAMLFMENDFGESSTSKTIIHASNTIQNDSPSNSQTNSTANTASTDKPVENRFDGHKETNTSANSTNHSVDTASLTTANNTQSYSNELPQSFGSKAAARNTSAFNAQQNTGNSTDNNARKASNRPNQATSDTNEKLKRSRLTAENAITNNEPNDLESANEEDEEDQESSTDETVTQTEPAGDIVGRVLADDGSVVSNITVTASPFDISPDQPSTARTPLTTTTDDEGYYRFNSVVKASFRICNKSTNTHTRSCIQVLPPQKTADIKVKLLNRELIVNGTVLDQDGAPVAGANIQVSIQNAPRINSNSDGTYSITFSIAAGDNPSLYFRHNDYSRYNKRVLRSEKITDNQFKLDATLIKKSGFTVNGNVVDLEGNPVAGQNIGLRGKSGGSRKYGRSNIEGKFSLSNIPAGEGYVATVIPSREYTYTSDGIPKDIAVYDDSTTFTVTLEKKQNSYGDLSLYIVSQDQQPISGVTLNLTAGGRRIGKATSSEEGEINFSNVPDGNLSLDSVALPLRVTGLQRDKHNGTTIQADKGLNEVRITVTGKDSEPVVCKRATLNWQSSQNGMRIRSIRNIAADETGVIYSSGFGAGDHELSLSSCPEHRNKKVDINVGSQVNFSVSLDPIR